ncbi:MAG: hypothetical protein JSV35_05720 [Candidatus Bathyarchaeota archaeon]|nr:MAG: hypothetical protein JSV35_05720 [Candidatus Bathyarchaeota archaeon]
MESIIVDVDDTLVYTGHRMQSLWRELLGRKIPHEALETLSLEQIFMKFASPEQKKRVTEFQSRFWDLLLCLEDAGGASLELHRPIPFAAEVVQAWALNSEIVYLTGRTENMRSATMEELKRFGFPVEGTRLIMFNPDDYARPKGQDPSGPTLVDTKRRLLAEICERSQVIRAIDDYPGYFPIFKEFEIPERIGLLQKKFTVQHYLDRGATRVVESWRELQHTS